MKWGLGLGMAAMLWAACSSGATVTPPSPQTPAEASVHAKSSGEFYDLADLPPGHLAYGAVGLLVWSGVPIEDEQGRARPDEALSRDTFLVWALAARNQPLTQGTDTLGAPQAPLQLEGAAAATALSLGWVAASDGASGLDDQTAQRIARRAAGKPAEEGYPWYTQAKGERLTRGEGARLLVEALRPEASSFDPQHGDAAQVLWSGKFWASVWDARLAKAAPGAARAVAQGRHRGATVDGLKAPEPGRYGAPSFDKSVRYLKDVGADSVAVIPTARLLRFDQPTLLHDAAAGYPRAEVEGALRQAKAQGVRVVLKPHLWLAPRPENQGEWTGSTRFSPEGWDEWFSRYRAMLLAYAESAERAGVDVFVLGTELKSATKRSPAYFQQLIREVRQVFRGEVTYAANHDEFQRIPFWGELDYVGIDAYFVLSAEEIPTVDELTAAWEGPKEELAEAARASGKKVLFLEAGYKPRTFAMKAPWEWRGSGDLREDIQAAGYEALFRALWGEEWFAGVYFWKYFSDLDSSAREVVGEEFLPYKRQAEGVLRERFRP